MEILWFWGCQEGQQRKEEKLQKKETQKVNLEEKLEVGDKNNYCYSTSAVGQNEEMTMQLQSMVKFSKYSAKLPLLIHI